MFSVPCLRSRCAPHMEMADNNKNKAYDNKEGANEGIAKGEDTRSRRHRHRRRNLLVHCLRFGRHCLVHPSLTLHGSTDSSHHTGL